MRLLLLLLVSLLGSACVKAQTTAPCSANVNALMAALSQPNATCNAGQWTISGSVTIPAGFNFFIYSDTVTVTGNYTGNSNSRTDFNLDPVKSSLTGFLNVQGYLISLGTVTFNLLEWDMSADTVTISDPFAQYAGRLNTASWSPSNPSLPSAFVLCWQVTGGAMNYRNSTVYMEPALSKIPGADCSTGKANRVWVVVFIVLLILWGIAFGILAWVTCKCCKETFWTNE